MMVNPVSSTDSTAQRSKREQREAYFQTLLDAASAALPETHSASDLRSKAKAVVKEHTFPSTRDEDWRFTDLSAMLDISFRADSGPAEIDSGVLDFVHLPEAIARIVFVNGQFSETLSDIDRLPVGVVVGSFEALQAEAVGEKLTARLAQANGNNEAFTALNTAGFQDAAVVWVPRNQVVEQPIQVVYLSASQGKPVMANTRCLVVAETGSALTLVEDFYGSQAQDSFNNSVTEMWVDENAQLTHVRLQREDIGAFHIGKTAVMQARDSAYTILPITLGSRLSRHNLEVYQQGPQTDTNLYGLTAIAHSQLADTHSLLALTHPHGTAEQVHKCIVDEAAHSVFNGKVWVSRTAQLTNASQINRNLLLSNKARVDTKPELDIVADNVKCAHGATVSQLSDSELFYLQSRGIDAAAARRMLISGFALDIINRIPIPSLQKRLTEIVIPQSTS